MWRFRHRGRGQHDGGAGTAVAERPNQAVEDLGESLHALEAEIEALTAANQEGPSGETERRLLAVRHLAGMRLVDGHPREPHFADPDTDHLAAGDPLPEISGAAQLSAGLLRAGILRDGCLLVRGLVPRADALALAGQIDAAFADREGQQAGHPPAGYYEHFVPHNRYGPVKGRPWIAQGGGLLAADAPALHFAMMEMFRAAGLPEIASAYLGEPALISVHKTTLRKADPSVPGAWHQDGYFMGEVRSLNLWLSLSRCGDVAPGLDLVPRRLDRYVATATDEAILDYTISQQRAAEAAGDHPIIRPIFEPGDALFFDEVFLHKTGSSADMPNPRYAVENWFFGGSKFPGEYAPIAV